MVDSFRQLYFTIDLKEIFFLTTKMMYLCNFLFHGHTKIKRKDEKNMKKKGILWVLLSVLLIVSLSGCKGGGIVGKSAECKSLINKFEKSCNEVDIQAILDCIDPKISDPIKAIVAIGGMVTDNVDEYLGDILEQFGSSISEITGGSGGSAKDIVASMKLTPKKYMLDKKDGSVKCKAEFEVNGMKTTKMLKISVVKKND